MPPIGKSFASLGRGLGEKHLVVNGVAWRPVSHAGAGEKGDESKNWMLRQPVKK